MDFIVFVKNAEIKRTRNNNFRHPEILVSKGGIYYGSRRYKILR